MANFFRVPCFTYKTLEIKEPHCPTTAKPQTFEENKQVAKRGGKVAGIARQALEAETGKPVITEKNAFDFQQLVTDIVEDAAELPENPTEKKDKD